MFFINSSFYKKHLLPGFVFQSVVIATFGIIALIAKGYGSLSWGAFIVCFIPLMILGLDKMIRKTQGHEIQTNNPG